MQSKVCTPIPTFPLIGGRSGNQPPWAAHGFISAFEALTQKASGFAGGNLTSVETSVMIDFVAIAAIYLLGESRNGYWERGHPVRLRAGSPRSNQTVA